MPGLTPISSRADPEGSALAAVRAFLAARGLLFLSVAVASLLLGHVRTRGTSPGVVGEAFPSLPLLSMWIRWDAYEWIARAAGSASPLRTEAVVAGPLFSLFVGGFSALVPVSVAALVVSFAASVGAAGAVGLLARHEPEPVDPRAAAWLLACLPTSYLLSVPSSTGMAVLLAGLTFLARARRRIILGSVAVFLGAAAHPAAALLLTVPFLLEAVVERSAVKDLPWFTLAAIPAVLLGDGVPPAVTFRPLLDPLFRIGPAVDFGPEVIPGSVAWVAALFAGVALLRARRYSFGVYTLGCLLLPWLSLASVGRAAALAFPAVLVLARPAFLPHRLLVLFAPLLVLATLLHVLGLSSD